MEAKDYFRLQILPRTIKDCQKSYWDSLISKTTKGCKWQQSTVKELYKFWLLSIKKNTKNYKGLQNILKDYKSLQFITRDKTNLKH